MFQYFILEHKDEVYCCVSTLNTLIDRFVTLECVVKEDADEFGGAIKNRTL